MGILDRIMGVTKKKDKFDIPKMDFGSHDEGTGTHDFGSSDMGHMGDTAPGLGGTSDLGSMSHHDAGSYPQEEETIHGFGHEDVKMEPAELRQEHRPFSKPTMMHEPQQFNQGNVSSKDLEIISSKLDTLRATLEMINSRLSSIEAQMNEQKRRGGW